MTIRLNRKERRAMGFRGPAYVHMIADKRPRFVRKHIDGAMEAEWSPRPLRRKERKTMARIRREAERIGLRY
jgi:hypothetical protein